MKSMQLIVITTGSYPYGGAATNRHISYLKGLVKMGVSIQLIVLEQEESQSSLSVLPEGDFEGIKYIYAKWRKNPQKSRTILCKIIDRISAQSRAIGILKKTVSKDVNTKLLVLLVNPIDIVPYLWIAHKRNIKIFHERTEFPFLGQDSFIKKNLLAFYLRKIIPKFSGIFVISKALVNYFKENKIDESKILHLPMTVDLDRFKINSGRVSDWGKYIAYCGSMYTDKDGVPILIEAFNVIAGEFCDLNLVLIGDNSDMVKFQHINQQIERSPYKTRIFVTGWMESDKIPSLLKGAQLLALARPDNIQAKGGFPTKLGEYLATGNPVVITDVGEHCLYLKDKFSAFISQPDSPVLFAEKIREALLDNSLAESVGKNGKIAAEKYFNSDIQAKALFDFIYGRRND